MSYPNVSDVPDENVTPGTDEMGPWVKRIRAAIDYRGSNDHEDVRSILREFATSVTVTVLDARIETLEDERDRLAVWQRAVADGLGISEGPGEGYPWHCEEDPTRAADYARKAADGLFELETQTAEGWRPPAAVITDRAELDKLPPRSVVIDGCEDEVLCRTNEGYWAEFGSDITCTSALVWLPATVLYIPTETGDTT